MTTQLRVRQLRSVIGVPEPLRLVVKGLGLRGPGTEVTVANTPSFRGMVKKVLHLVAVEEIKAPSDKVARPKASAEGARR
jgi:large subunit ribosomal protein L30